MSQIIYLDDQQFQLLCNPVRYENIKDNLLDSRTYNSGLDYFLGCDFVDAQAFLISKENTSLFTDTINKFFAKHLAKIESFYEDSYPELYFLLKETEHFTIAITNFHEDYIFCDELIEPYSSFINQLKPLSLFNISAGANFSDDYDLSVFAIGYIFKNHPSFKNQFSDDHQEQIEDYIDSLDRFNYEEANPSYIFKFITTYFLNIPRNIHPNSFDNKFIEILKKI